MAEYSARGNIANLLGAGLFLSRCEEWHCGTRRYPRCEMYRSAICSETPHTDVRLCLRCCGAEDVSVVRVSDVAAQCYLRGGLEIHLSACRRLWRLLRLRQPGSTKRAGTPTGSSGSWQAASSLS